MTRSNLDARRKMRFPLLGAVAATAALVAVLSVAGCGGGDGGDTSSTASTAAEEETPATNAGGAGGGKTLEIKMGDYFFSPSTVTAKAGKATIVAPNEGSVEHELVVFKTNLNPANLPTESNGEVDEEKLDEIAGEEGEVSEVAAGETKSGNFELTPGKYVIFCNLPGHYAQGMYGTLTVSK
jgi:uncharacterized cupredoxin-like copper-binding protein